jgi:hypothetical protein
MDGNAVSQAHGRWEGVGYAQWIRGIRGRGRMTSKAKLILSDEDLQELVAFFPSPTDDELRQVLEPSHTNFYKLENLEAEYALTQERREFAEDAWRAVTYFLCRKGFNLRRNGVEYDLGESSGYSGG